MQLSSDKINTEALGFVFNFHRTYTPKCRTPPFKQRQVEFVLITDKTIITASVVSATANECSSRTSSFIIADRCIDVIDDVTTYFKARDLCWKRGPAADLVQLKTEMDNEQAAAALRAYVNSTQSQLPSRFWIGLVRTRWQWASGTRLADIQSMHL